MLKILSLFSLITSFTVNSDNHNKSANIIAGFKYDILLEGDNSGAMSVKISKSINEGYNILTKSDFELSGWWGSHLISSNLIEQFSSSGILLKADNMIIDGKKAYWTRMVLTDDELWTSSVQVKSVKQHEEEEFIGMMANIGSMFVSGAGDVLAVFSLLSADAESSHNNIRLSQNSYDTSFNNIPFYWLMHNKSLPDEVSILDSDNLSIYKMKIEIQDAENSNQELAGSSSYHYILTPEKGEPLHMWLTTDENNTPYFLQLTGEDEDGPFQIKIKQA